MASDTLTVFVTAQAVVDAFGPTERFERAVELLRKARVGRVVLESYRGGTVVEESLLAEVRDRCQAAGLATLGGIMPVQGGTFGKHGVGIETRAPFFCYTDEDTVAALEAEIRKLARVFGQVVIDDAFLTSCRCADCIAARGEQSWAVFRRDLLCAVAERWVRAAKEEKADVQVTVKFPQYYDRYHLFGYDAARFPQIFDKVWQGTETRDPETLAYGYAEPYEGYFNTSWMRACAGGKLETAWFDYLDCDEQLFYEQAVTTFLAAPEHVTVFCYSDELLGGSKMTRVAEALPALQRLKDAARNPWGAHVVKPPNSDGGRDLFIFDYLGMLGIPCVPATRLDPSMRSAILPAHAADDADTVAAIPKVLEAGGTIVATFDALLRWVERPDVLALFGYGPEGVAHGGSMADMFEIPDGEVAMDTPVRVAGDLAPSDASVLVSAAMKATERSLLHIPFITSREHASGGRAVVWNIGTFGDDDFDVREQLNVPVKTTLFGLPKAVLDLLRDTATAALGVTVNAPARVATFLFEEHVVFVNYGDAPAEVEVSGVHWKPETLFSDSAKTACSAQGLLLASRSYAMLEVERPA